MTTQILDRLPNAALLAVAAMLVAIAFAIPLGILAAVYRGTAIDHAAMATALAGISMPNFWLGPLLAILFAVWLGWLPVSGSTGTIIAETILLAIALVAVLGPSLRNVVLALSVIGWVGHVLPTALPSVVVQATLGMAHLTILPWTGDRDPGPRVQLPGRRIERPDRTPSS